MTPDAARDALVDVAMQAVHGALGVQSGPPLEAVSQLRYELHAVVDAILMARATCWRCGDGQDEKAYGLCPSCGGEPGGLLVLLALGGERWCTTTERSPAQAWAFPVPSTPDTKES